MDKKKKSDQDEKKDKKKMTSTDRISPNIGKSQNKRAKRSNSGESEKALGPAITKRKTTTTSSNLKFNYYDYYKRDSF